MTNAQPLRNRPSTLTATRLNVPNESASIHVERGSVPGDLDFDGAVDLNNVAAWLAAEGCELPTR